MTSVIELPNYVRVVTQPKGEFDIDGCVLQVVKVEGVWLTCALPATDMQGRVIDQRFVRIALMDVEPFETRVNRYALLYGNTCSVLDVFGPGDLGPYDPSVLREFRIAVGAEPDAAVQVIPLVSTRMCGGFFFQLTDDKRAIVLVPPRFSVKDGATREIVQYIADTYEVSIELQNVQYVQQLVLNGTLDVPTLEEFIHCLECSGEWGHSREVAAHVYFRLRAAPNRKAEDFSPASVIPRVFVFASRSALCRLYGLSFMQTGLNKLDQCARRRGDTIIPFWRRNEMLKSYAVLVGAT